MKATIVLALSLLSVDAFAADPDRVEWSPDWPRVRLVEGLDAVALGIASLAIALEWKSPQEPRWTSGILFDDAIRDAFRGRTRSAQSTATDISNALYLGGVAIPLIMDLYVVTLGIHQSSDVAIQMLFIDAQSFALSGVITLGAGRIAARARPYATDCSQSLYNTCGTDRDSQSFISGHSAATATMAGLTCAHHQHLPLYGGGVADAAPCAFMIGVSLATGVSRVIGDQHWASDVILGWALGAFSGYVLPSILHYGFGSDGPIGELDVGGARLIPVPQAYVDGAGLGFVGSY
jgi:membrane-associated phospholipid phosphatase